MFAPARLVSESPERASRVPSVTRGEAPQAVGKRVAHGCYQAQNEAGHDTI